VKIKAAKFTASVLRVRSLLFFSVKNLSEVYLKPWFCGFTQKGDKMETKVQNVSEVKPLDLFFFNLPEISTLQ